MFNYENTKLLAFFVIYDKYIGYVTHSMTYLQNDFDRKPVAGLGGQCSGYGIYLD